MNHIGRLNEKLNGQTHLIDWGNARVVGPAHKPEFVGMNAVLFGKEYKVEGSFPNKTALKQALAEKICAGLNGTTTDEVIHQPSNHIEPKIQWESIPVTTFVDPGFKIYLVDLDNQSRYLKSFIEMNDEIHLFAGMAQNRSVIPKAEHITVHYANKPVKEMVDHMITYWASRNLEELKSVDEVIICSTDAGLYALCCLLQDDGVNCKFQNGI